jgi:endoglucanase
LVFTGDEFADGGKFIAEELWRQKIKTSFFFTGRFYRNKKFKKIIQQLKTDGHYLGPHSDQHLLYCDWTKRDSLLVTKKQFNFDLADNYTAMAQYGIDIKKASYFLPPYEWYNDTIAVWTKDLQLQLINFTPGTRSHADYTTPLDKNYRSSEEIYKSIIDYENTQPWGLNGFILLMHIGTDPKRTDKFYHRLPDLIKHLKAKGYQFQRVDKLLTTD